MSVQVENLEKNMAKLTIEVAAEEVEKAIQAAYLKEKGKISMPGFRKGKVPRKMIEKMYGEAVFYEDAANTLIQENYPAAVEESGIDIVSRPTIDVVQIESGKPFIFTAEVAVRPEVKLGKYLGVQVTKIDTSVSDEEVEAAVEKERNNNARTVTVTDRPIANGDTAVIDFEGFVDGVAFEGGKGENHPLEIGSHSFIDTFEDQLVGKNAGDEVEVNVTFPEKYQAADLAGKPAMFKVKIHEVKCKELPELNDEFAQDVSEFDTLEEYKADVKKHLEVEKENEAKKTKEDEAIQKIIDKSTMEIPEAMIETQCENMVNEFAQRLAQSGLSMEQYMQFSGLTLDKLKEQVRPEAETRIKSSLVLEQIAKDEKIEITDEELDAEIEKMATQYGMEADKLKEYIGDNEKESMKRDLAVTKAVDLIMENVKERAKAKSKKEKEAEDISKDVEQSLRKKFKKKIWSKFTKAINTYELVKPGDKIAVCISGGKDSMLMAKLFQELLKHGKANFELVFLVMNPGYNEDNWKIIQDNAKVLGIPLTVFETQIFDTVADIDKNPCYLCARMRRGYLYSHAKELGCNKIALGHHFDDVIETILMGMFYGGKVETMMPKLHSQNFEGMELIRPMYLIKEDDIIAWRDYNQLNFIQCACRFTENCVSCGGGRGSKRDEMKELIKEFRKQGDIIEKNIFRSVHNVNLRTIIGYHKDDMEYNFLDDYNERGK